MRIDETFSALIGGGGGNLTELVFDAFSRPSVVGFYTSSGRWLERDDRAEDGRKAAGQDRTRFCLGFGTHLGIEGLVRWMPP
jgi:hypothetical protein